MYVPKGFQVPLSAPKSSYGNPFEAPVSKCSDLEVQWTFQNDGLDTARTLYFRILSHGFGHFGGPGRHAVEFQILFGMDLN